MIFFYTIKLAMGGLCNLSN